VGASSLQFLQIIQLDRANDDLYPVASAYNGAILYPLHLVRKNNPKYDAGPYGHTCEHVLFNRGVDKQIFINPKWVSLMSPAYPGGPKGERALKAVQRFGSIPRVAIPLVLQSFLPLVLSIYCIMTLGVHSLRPIAAKALQRRRI
jgi:hypothetical protein